MTKGVFTVLVLPAFLTVFVLGAAFLNEIKADEGNEKRYVNKADKMVVQFPRNLVIKPDIKQKLVQPYRIIDADANKFVLVK